MLNTITDVPQNYSVVIVDDAAAWFDLTYSVTLKTLKTFCLEGMTFYHDLFLSGHSEITKSERNIYFSRY